MRVRSCVERGAVSIDSIGWETLLTGTCEPQDRLGSVGRLLPAAVGCFLPLSPLAHHQPDLLAAATGSRDICPAAGGGSGHRKRWEPFKMINEKVK